MFASPSYIPVVSLGTEKKIPFPALQYQEEYQLIKDTLRKEKKEVILHKVHGTPEKFAEMLEKQRPGAIHFSGHGVTAEQIRKENYKFKAFTLMSDSTIEEIF